MLFSGLAFIFRFLPIFLIVYYICPSKFKNLVIFIGSLIFYAIGEPAFAGLMLAEIIINYGLIRLISKCEKISLRRFMTSIVIVLDIGVLFVFKYFDFFAENVNLIGGAELIPVLGLTLPLGISFYTFQMLSYAVDVCRKEYEPNSFLKFATYITMFPQLIAGPIVKYVEVSDDLDERHISLKDVETGFRTFVMGLASKVLLADRMAGLWNEIATVGFRYLSTPAAWLGSIAFSFQLYFDFWGYSLMAMGLGRMLGFKIPKNFDVPYLAHTMTEFWRRWHITLGRFFREYLYFPMGGSKGSRLRTFFNILVVWSLTGLWHGASWNFVIWGLFLFLILIIEKATFGKAFESKKNVFLRILSRIYMCLLIPISWTIFQITDLGELIIYLKQLVGVHTDEVFVSWNQLLLMLKNYGPYLGVCLLLSTYLPMHLNKLLRKVRVVPWLICIVLFWFCVYRLAVSAENPFLYFRF